MYQIQDRGKWLEILIDTCHILIAPLLLVRQALRLGRGLIESPGSYAVTIYNRATTN